jgi:hypothetical protein
MIEGTSLMLGDWEKSMDDSSFSSSRPPLISLKKDRVYWCYPLKEIETQHNEVKNQ